MTIISRKSITTDESMGQLQKSTFSKMQFVWSSSVYSINTIFHKIHTCDDNFIELKDV